MIRSTFYGFGTALSGMNIAQKALDVTGNNISNVDTTGYTRQRLDLYSIPSANFADRYSTKSSHHVGQGVDITRVAQLRDPFLDNRFRREAASIGEIDANLSTLNDVTVVFDEVQSKALQQALMDFRTQLQKYTDQTSSVEIESTVRAAAESVTRLFNQYSNELDAIRNQQENLLTDVTVEKVDNILQSISLLNKNIKECEIYGNPALELRDQRNMLLDELSTYMKIDIQEEEDLNLKNQGLPGIMNLRVSFQSNNTLTQGQRTLILNDTHADFTSSKDTNGDIQFHSSWAQASTAPAVNIQFTTGALKGAQDMLNKSGEFDTPPGTVRGIGYYEQVLDRIVADFADMFNKANSTSAAGDPYNKPMFAAGDGSAAITAGNISIASGWADSTYGLTYTKTTPPVAGGDVSGARENLLYMINLLDKKNDYTTNGIGGTGQSLYKGTFEEMFANIGNIAALDVKSKNDSLESHTNVITGIEDLRNSISSVSMDEEGVNLLRFQKSYTAAARVMTTLDEALDVLINRMGIVGR